jgi:hypothetical protein
VLLAGCSDSGTPAASPTPSATPAPSASLVEPVDPLSPKPPVESPAPSPTGSTCDPADLTVTDADLLADERQLQEVFAVRTRGPACRLRGWPTISLLGPDDAPIRVTTRRTGTAAELALTKETSLSFVLSTPRTTDCQDVAAVVVTLPGTSRAIRTGTTMQVCHGELGVGPVERRQDTD